MLAPQRQAERALILDGLGLDEMTVTRPLSYAIDRLVEAHFISQSYIQFLAASGGVITSKGRTRRAVDGWRKSADAVAKFAAMVGLERVEQPAYSSTRDWLLAERERTEQTADAARSDTNTEPTTVPEDQRCDE